MQPIHPSRHRKIRTWVQGENSSRLKAVDASKQSKSLLDLASNDYLDLANHPAIIEAAHKITKTHGIGAGASRLVTGSRLIHLELEEALAKWLGRESVLLFPSGFQANIAAVMAMADRSSIVIADRLIHNSLLTGIKAAGAKLKRFAHNDLNDLCNQLKKCSLTNANKRKLVITESLFSMEGTNPCIESISKLCEEYGAKLLVDEAHALGVMGSEGKGLCFQKQAPIPVNIISGTFGKAFGSGGAFLACDRMMREHLLQTSGAFRYTTALAPPLAAAALAALRLIQQHPSWGIDLIRRAKYWRDELSTNGWEKPLGEGPIIPLLIGKDEEALKYQKQLEEKGLLTIAIRPPTVPENTSRLRLVVRRNLPDESLKNLLKVIGKS